MYSSWLCDLEEAISALREKEIETFTSITVNAFGDFIFESGGGIKYLIKHNTYEVFKFENKKWKNF